MPKFSEFLKLSVFVALFSIAIYSCKSKKNKVGQTASNGIEDVFVQKTSTLVKLETGYELSGNLKNKPENLLVLFEMGDKLVFIDSVRTDSKGDFKIKGDLKHPLICQLQWGSESAIILVLDNKSKIKLEIDPQGSSTSYGITGEGIGPTVELKELLETSNVYYQQFQNLESQAKRVDRQAADAAQQIAGFEAQYYSLIKKRTDAIREKVMKSESSLVPYVAITAQMIENVDLPLIVKAKEVTNKFAPDSKYAKQMEALYNAEKSLGIGAVAPDFSMAQLDTTAKLKLSDLRGKYVLIDFWASWCRPCRAENPNNVRIYQRFKEKGFEILGVSLDDNKGRWQSAVIADKLTWKHVSELQGWRGKVNQQYKVTGIPKTVLLDPEGKILAKDLRGAQLEAKLAEIFSKTSN